MNTRIRQAVAHFPSPFRLASADGLFPEGAYAIDVHEALSASDMGSVYTPVATFMHLPIISEGKWALRSVVVTDAEMAEAIVGGEDVLAIDRHTD